MDRLGYTPSGLDANSYIGKSLLTKSLSNDLLYYMEGTKQENNPEFIPKKESK